MDLTQEIIFKRKKIRFIFPTIFNITMLALCILEISNFEFERYSISEYGTISALYLLTSIFIVTIILFITSIFSKRLNLIVNSKGVTYNYLFSTRFIPWNNVAGFDLYSYSLNLINIYKIPFVKNKKSITYLVILVKDKNVLFKKSTFLKKYFFKSNTKLSGGPIMIPCDSFNIGPSKLIKILENIYMSKITFLKSF